MNRRLGLAAYAVLVIALAGCRGRTGTGSTGGSSTGGGSGATGPLVEVTPSYTQFRQLDVCKDIPAEKVDKIMGEKVSRDVEAYTVEARDVGCYYPFGRKDNKPIFVYISVGPTLQYLYNRDFKPQMITDSGLGDEAFVRTLEDHKQFWVLLNGRAGVVVGMVNFDLDKAKELSKLGVAIAPKQ